MLSSLGAAVVAADHVHPPTAPEISRQSVASHARSSRVGNNSRGAAGMTCWEMMKSVKTPIATPIMTTPMNCMKIVTTFGISPCCEETDIICTSPSIQRAAHRSNITVPDSCERNDLSNARYRFTPLSLAGNIYWKLLIHREVDGVNWCPRSKPDRVHQHGEEQIATDKNATEQRLTGIQPSFALSSAFRSHVFEPVVVREAECIQFSPHNFKFLSEYFKLSNENLMEGNSTIN